MAYNRFDISEVFGPASGGRLVKSYDDPITDQTVALVEVRLDGRDARRAQLGNRLDYFVDAVGGQIDRATMALRYGKRPRPRLGAGTVGYARRRR
jgi:hypothetical protein